MHKPGETGYASNKSVQTIVIGTFLFYKKRRSSVEIDNYICCQSCYEYHFIYIFGIRGPLTFLGM